MKKEERIIRQKELIEQYGILLEEMGYQPVTARVSGLLSVMDKELLTFEEIVDELNISKSTASVAIKNLLVRDAIEYITLPGDRKRYFRTKLASMDREPKDFIVWLKKIKKLMQETVELKKDKDSRIANYFKEVDEKLNIYIPKMEKLNDDLT
jgi:DNA-binding transcriptional regulator GbsR (MarR family)